jgi:integrase
MPSDEPRRKAARIGAHTFAAVIRAYLVSPKFEKLAKSTKTTYRYLLSIAERPDVLGAKSIDEMRPALIQAFLDGFSDRPAYQRNAQTAIKSLEKWAFVRELLPGPISFGTEAPGGTGGHKPWTDEQVRLAELHARPHLARMITLAANTGQRGSDLIRMRWSDLEEYDGRVGINVTQIKTGVKIWIPLTQDLQTAIAAWERRPTYLILKEDGQPFAGHQLSDQWLRERASNAALAPLAKAGLVIHGLRATAVVRLRRAGATTGQISDMVGMSEPMVKRYCRFSAQRENALAAIYHLDRTRTEQTKAGRPRKARKD